MSLISEKTKKEEEGEVKRNNTNQVDRPGGSRITLCLSVSLSVGFLGLSPFQEAALRSRICCTTPASFSRQRLSRGRPRRRAG